MATKPITAYGFRGMNNLPGQMPAKLVDDERRITPHFLLNAEVADGGGLRKRRGYQKANPLSACHSLWAGSVMLCVSNGSLCQVEGAQVTTLAAVEGPPARLCYAEVSNRIFMSSPFWNGILDLLEGSVVPWGVAPPAAPQVTLLDGDLPPGRYVFCYTRIENGDLSGNSPLVEVAWEGGSRGIRLNNLPSGGQCWLTYPNGQKLLLANILNSVVTGQVPQANPLPSLNVTLPPRFAHFTHAFGRIWGVAGKQLFYSNPFQPTWFGKDSFIPFQDDLVMVASVASGLLVNSGKSTWHLDGTNPGEMEFMRVGDGAVPGTLIYANLPGALVGGGNEMTRRLAEIPSPVWMSKNGFVAGTQTGRLVHLTEHRLQITPKADGASIYFLTDGVPRIFTSMSGPLSNAEQDDAVGSISQMGRLFPPAFKGVAASGFSLSGTCVAS